MNWEIAAWQIVTNIFIFCHSHSSFILSGVIAQMIIVVSCARHFELCSEHRESKNENVKCAFDPHGRINAPSDTSKANCVRYVCSREKWIINVNLLTLRNTSNSVKLINVLRADLTLSSCIVVFTQKKMRREKKFFFSSTALKCMKWNKCEFYLCFLREVVKQFYWIELVVGVEYSLLCAKKSAKFGGKVKVNCIYQGKIVCRNSHGKFSRNFCRSKSLRLSRLMRNYE